MASQADVRRIALSLPEASEAPGFVFQVAGKSFAWPWRERTHPKRPRVPDPDVMGVRVANELEKQALLSLDTNAFFTEPHYDGYPAVLVRLPAIEGDLLERSSPTPGAPRPRRSSLQATGSSRQAGPGYQCHWYMGT